MGHTDVRRAEAGRFDHVLVDEYQDTSGIQERIVAALARDVRLPDLVEEGPAHAEACMSAGWEAAIMRLRALR